ncbi:MAG TPA: MaoC family dehydratase [Acidimicrobiales bacterium]|nr:MaoC family dehydratase [Acidimicrobiales bacterium]
MTIDKSAERTEKDWEGRFFEDFDLGVTYEHAGGRTIESVDNAWFTLLTNNNNEIHYNSDYARSGLHGRRLVNSCFTISVVTGLSVAGVSRNAAANLGWDKVRLPAPVFEGDTLRARSTVLELRRSRSRPETGIVTVRTEGYKQDGTVVITFDRTVLVWSRERQS